MIIRTSLCFILIFAYSICFAGEPESGYVNTIPCGGWSAELGIKEKCSELKLFFDEWEPKAKACNPEAQQLMGLKYSRDPSTWIKAVEWFKKASIQGYPPAQFELGVRYEYGEGVLQDYCYAYMWYNLSSSKGYAKARSAMLELSRNMTPESIAKAQNLARAWKVKPCEKEVL